MTASSELAVLFADVSGSTRLYETLGDERALATVGRCVELMREACDGHAGRVIKTIGDEVMAVFPLADEAAQAAAVMQARIGAEAVHAARSAWRSASGSISVLRSRRAATCSAIRSMSPPAWPESRRRRR